MTDKIRYQPQDIEPKWQARWEADGLYRARVDWNQPKYYALTMLPYPSGELHIGHWFAMTPSDARARYMRMKGYNVLFPMGFDAFGLPAENAAVQRGIHPAEWTYKNIDRMRRQMKSMGAMFDWEREAVSCEPEYYRWTEWFFKKFYENGYAYRGEALVNWSDTLQTVLANEQVIDGKDERTGQPVVQKLLTQWFFKMTAYAEELLSYDGIDWPEPIRTMQTNWIGKSEGARVTFHTEAGEPFEIFTTRPDTLWGVTFMVLAPEHPLVERVTTPDRALAVKRYQQTAARLNEIDRTSDSGEKTGVFTGGYAINPVNNERVPIFIADYVMISYGTGAIMAVPWGDQRDWQFAKRYDLEIRPVIVPDDAPADIGQHEAYAGAGRMVNSGRFDGTLSNGEKGRRNPAIAAVIDWLSEQGTGRENINYRLRDWLISRQRYWGSPIPIVYTADGAIETVPDEELPVLLPQDVVMTGAGNPLISHPTFMQAQSDGQPARRETDTMDTFMCSSWYFLRYLSPHDDRAPFDPEEAAYWLPVDVYTGGAEHATMHLLYARFFTKAMRDLDMFDDTARVMAAHGRDAETAFNEPMKMLRNQGQILGEERDGDTIVAKGTLDGDKLFAKYVEVVDSAASTVILGGYEAAVMGEIVKRTENLMTVRTIRGLRTVEVLPEAKIVIPSIPAPNTVTQLKHHLEIQRMSKSKGNVINPDDWVESHGADTVRAYLMFGFDWSKGGPWDSKGIQGPARWLYDVWDLATTPPGSSGDAETERQVERRVHQTIKRVGIGLESFSFNTAIASLMELKNEIKAAVRDGRLGEAAWRDALRAMVLMMAPFTPHIAEELWERLGGAYSVHQQAFPAYDAAKAAEGETDLIIMRNGKPIDSVRVVVGMSQDEAKRIALASAKIQQALNGGEPKKVIYVAGRGENAAVEPKVNVVI